MKTMWKVGPGYNGKHDRETDNVGEFNTEFKVRRVEKSISRMHSLLRELPTIMNFRKNEREWKRIIEGCSCHGSEISV